MLRTLAVENYRALRLLAACARGGKFDGPAWTWPKR